MHLIFQMSAVDVLTFTVARIGTLNLASVVSLGFYLLLWKYSRDNQVQVISPNDFQIAGAQIQGKRGYRKEIEFSSLPVLP